MIQQPKIRWICAWVKSNTWQDKRLVATGLDQFFSVFQFFDKPCNWQPKISEFVQLQPVVQYFAVGFSSVLVFFFSPVNWTCEHYCTIMTNSSGPSVCDIFGSTLHPFNIWCDVWWRVWSLHLYLSYLPWATGMGCSGRKISEGRICPLEIVKTYLVQFIELRVPQA